MSQQNTLLHVEIFLQVVITRKINPFRWSVTSLVSIYLKIAEWGFDVSYIRGEKKKEKKKETF